VFERLETGTGLRWGRPQFLATSRPSSSRMPRGGTSALDEVLAKICEGNLIPKNQDG